MIAKFENQTQKLYLPTMNKLMVVMSLETMCYSLPKDINDTLSTVLPAVMEP